jgi:hypothetical protein
MPTPNSQKYQNLPLFQGCTWRPGWHPPGLYAASMSFRNRKGAITQNCLFASSFNMRFLYALTGWEGSATDARVYEDARGRDFTIPDSKYYLADTGYPSCNQLLIPYRGVRYHLAEWGRAGVR